MEFKSSNGSFFQQEGKITNTYTYCYMNVVFLLPFSFILRGQTTIKWNFIVKIHFLK